MIVTLSHTENYQNKNNVFNNLSGIQFVQLNKFNYDFIITIEYIFHTHPLSPIVVLGEFFK